MFEALKCPEDPAVARVYYELANLSRYDIEWEWISHQAEGEYLLRDEVLAVVERHLAANKESDS